MNDGDANDDGPRTAGEPVGDQEPGPKGPETAADPTTNAAEPMVPPSSPLRSYPDATPGAAPGGDSADASVASGNGDRTVSEAAENEPEEPKELSLEEQLAAAQGDIKAMRDKWLRTAADFDNFRKRNARELEDARRRGTQTAVRDLLPVFDNLERAVAHASEGGDAASIALGMRMVSKQLIDSISKLGIQRIESVGKPFDPSQHDGIQQAHSSEHDAGLVLAELQPGYRMGAELLRPALVVVSLGPEQPAVSNEADTQDAAAVEATDATDEPATAASSDEVGDEEG